jgi:hypothetical protein
LNGPVIQCTKDQLWDNSALPHTLLSPLWHFLTVSTLSSNLFC